VRPRDHNTREMVVKEKGVECQKQIVDVWCGVQLFHCGSTTDRPSGISLKSSGLCKRGGLDLPTGDKVCLGINEATGSGAVSSSSNTTTSTCAGLFMLVTICRYSNKQQWRTRPRHRSKASLPLGLTARRLGALHQIFSSSCMYAVDSRAQ
jgi:hypothetical protein